MIYPSKYNGINFSPDFARDDVFVDFGLNRRKYKLPITDFKCITFYVTNVVDSNTAILYIDNDNGYEIVEPLNSVQLDSTSWVFYFGDFNTFDSFLQIAKSCHFSFKCDSDIVYSEIYEIVSQEDLDESGYCKIIAYNNDNRHGFLTATYPAFGFFKLNKFKSDFFVNSKTEYSYSYGRKKILMSENQIGKRFTFQDLTLYQQNLLKWLCNCENLFIDGVNYQLVSNFTELLSDQNSEIMDLQADFVEVEQSFFSKPSTKRATNVFTSNFFMK